MSHYRRPAIAGASYFFTQVVYDRNQPWLCRDIAREALRAAIMKVRGDYPFAIDAFVLLPDHLHCIWTLPENDGDYASRWRLIKSRVTRSCADVLDLDKPITASRHARKERNLWQRRYWEHVIRDDMDFNRHLDYIHYNPVKHGLCRLSWEWPYSSFRRFVQQGAYPQHWGAGGELLHIRDMRYE